MKTILIRTGITVLYVVVFIMVIFEMMIYPIEYILTGTDQPFLIKYVDKISSLSDKYTRKF